MNDVDPLLEGGDQGKSAAATVKLPAIFLISIAGLGILFALAQMIMPGQQPAAGQEIPPEMQEFVDFLQGTGKFLIAGVLIVLNSLIALGAVKMLNLSSRGLSLMACVLALVNPTCCCLTFPFGVWGLMVLNDEKVKAAFDRAGTPDF